ncbi:MAG TPA: D-tagatose-bisphosphate aldolase, class II, non-catalytic subunit [Steroidobacteraceae bacterium]|jgi:D-tagatose-1,6-bisphosphate aldolase subunit GatZ/KbaZ|nr:D-tagatose-bisphosphate aldolase, class II, non-catalytic subunit [Steroidobacteraceae bacterium]
MKALLDLVRRHRGGEAVGIYSVCSAHPLALRAALEHARATGGYALIEATSNQVNQEGGYTGLRPAQFRDLVWSLADASGLPRGRVLLGGDHLGPNAWQSLPAGEALSRASVMVSEYVRAGYRKIHLDCSMPCAGDPPVLTDEIVAERTAALCTHAEEAWRKSGGEPPVYVVGTEVPVPGGAQEDLHELAVTEPRAAVATVAAHRFAFAAAGMQSAWDRVIALVVQPGVEFDHDRVIDYRPQNARHLSQCLDQLPNLVFEAHSTDYQTEVALASLVRDHFAILKVGPAITFALREAVWALDSIEQEWRGSARSANVRTTILRAMRANPGHWRKYYHETGAALDLQLQYSLSDRIRYYWPDPAVVAALDGLRATFEGGTPPLALLSQYLPAAHAAVRAGTIPARMSELVIHHIRQVLSRYSRASDPQTSEEGSVS